LFIYMVWEE